MAENKCFCHLNGYEVKDATAREMTAALQTQLETEVENLNGRMDIQAEHISDILATQRTQGAKIETLEQGIPDLIARSQLIELQERVTDIEENSTGGGSKLYRHVINIYEENNDMMDVYISIFSASAEAIDTKEKLCNALSAYYPTSCRGVFNILSHDSWHTANAVNIISNDNKDAYHIEGVFQVAVNNTLFGSFGSGLIDINPDWSVTYADEVTEV